MNFNRFLTLYNHYHTLFRNAPVKLVLSWLWWHYLTISASSGRCKKSVSLGATLGYIVRCCLRKTEQANKQINKQTNKQINSIQTPISSCSGSAPCVVISLST